MHKSHAEVDTSHHMVTTESIARCLEVVYKMTPAEAHKRVMDRRTIVERAMRHNETSQEIARRCFLAVR